MGRQVGACLRRAVRAPRVLTETIYRPSRHRIQSARERGRECTACWPSDFFSLPLAAGAAVRVGAAAAGRTAGVPAAAEAPAFLDAFQRHLIAGQTLVQALLPGMRAARWGRIVNVVSTSVREPIAGLGVSNTIRAEIGRAHV